MITEWERGIESPEDMPESQTAVRLTRGRSLGSCACKVPSHTLPPNVLTPRDGDTVPNVHTGALSLRAAQLDPGSCEVWLLAQDSH